MFHEWQFQLHQMTEVKLPCRVCFSLWNGPWWCVKHQHTVTLCRKSDWKKAYVLFEPPLEIKQQWLEKREEQQRQRLNELKQAALQRQRLPHFPQAAAVALAQDAAAAVAQSAAADRAAVLAERQRRMEAAKQWKQQRKQQKQKQQQGAAAVSGSNKGGSGSRSGGSSRSVAVAACVIEACLVAK